MKIDRNAICTCGSGKKFKDCCLQKIDENNDQAHLYFLNYHIPVFSKMFVELGPNIDFLRNQLTDTHIRNFFSLLAPPSTFSYLTSIDILEKWKNSLESLMETIISRHHVFYWFHLYRRLAPENVFGYSSNVSTFLVRNILETAFIKYGNISEDKFEEEILYGNNIDINQIMSGEYSSSIKEIRDKTIKDFASGIYIKKFSISNFLELLSVEVIASEYHSATANFRRANKGGKLKVVSDDHYFVENDDDDEYLISSYDRRNELYGGDVTSRGLPLQTMQIEKGSKGFIMIPIYNVSRLTFKDYPFHKIWQLSFDNIESFSPNFIWVALDLDKFYRINYFIKDAFSEYYGFSLESFLNCIIGLYLYISFSRMREPLRIGDALVQRAYQSFESKSFLVENIYELLNHESYFIGEHAPTEADIFNVLDTFTFTDIKRHQIDLTTMGPRPFIIPTLSGSIMVDYAALLPILSSVTHFIKADESPKGKIYEDYVINELTKHNFIKWEKGHLKGFDGSIIEIDISFINKNIMFLCELKCINRSFAFERGDAEAIRFRTSKFEDALTQCDNKVKWLSSRKDGHNFHIPNEVAAIIPVVVSPFVEYIWSRNESYWLTDEIPRICTLEELTKLKEPDVLKKVVKKSFVRYIS